MRITLALFAALLVVGCIHVRIDEAALARMERWADEEEGASAPSHYLVVRATPLEESEEGKHQILLESSLVTVPASSTNRAIETAEAYTHDGPTKVWLGGSQAPDASFGLRAKVLELPSIVSLDGEEANVEVGAREPRGAGSYLHSLRMDPVAQGGAIELTVAYTYLRERRAVRALQETVVSGPGARVWIFEIVPAPVGSPADESPAK